MIPDLWLFAWQVLSPVAIVGAAVAGGAWTGRRVDDDDRG